MSDSKNYVPLPDAKSDCHVPNMLLQHGGQSFLTIRFIHTKLVPIPLLMGHANTTRLVFVYNNLNFIITKAVLRIEQ